ncbi:MAG: hypothetical protein HOI33_11460, partial [Rhodospirillaceae bacterium]|nr:hypothetical protein [Rhodospirillaceae bacterium]
MALKLIHAYRFQILQKTDKTMHLGFQRLATVLLTLTCFALTQGCSTSGELTGTPYKLPDAITELSPESQATLRAVFTIDGVVGPVTMQIDTASATASGQYVLPNDKVEDATIHIELYGSLSSATEEVLLGSVNGSLTIEPGQYNSANLDPMTTAGDLYDANRNGTSNLDDLKVQIDPAPMANPLDVSPDTISFDSGVEVGGFTRSFFVVENNGEEQVSMDMAVELAPGITIAPLEAIFELGSAAPEDTFSLTLAPDEEQVMAVTFAPSDALFLAGALSVNSTTQTSNISHGLMMRLIGNPEGAVPQPPSAYSIPNPSSVALDGYTGSIQAYGINQLFSREPFNPSSMSEQDSGTIAGQDIDDAYLVVVPRGYRFSLTLDGLTEDVDLFLFDADATLDPDGNLTALAVNDFGSTTNSEHCTGDLTVHTVDCSTNVGQSSESISYDGTQQSEANRYLIVALDVREVPTLNDGDANANQGDTTTQPLTGQELQGAGMQAAMYNRPDIEFIQSTRPCPNNKYGQAACSSADGQASLTIYGVNFEPGMTAAVTWRDIATGNEVSSPANCSPSPTPDQPVNPPRQDSDGNIVSGDEMILDSIICISPPAVVNPQVGPKANLVLTNPDGAVAVKPEAIVYLPPEPEVNRVFPAAGPTTGGTSLTIYGDNFYELNGRQPIVAFGTYPVDTIGMDNQPTDSEPSGAYVFATVRSLSEDGREIIVELPECDGCEAVTPHALTVINPDLQYTQEGSLFTYVKPAGPGPELLGVEPSAGTVEGQSVHLYGNNFFDTEDNPIVTIMLDNRDVIEFTTYAAGSPECPETIGEDYDCIALDVPAHAPGAVPVEISNGEEQTSRLPNGFTYQFPNPVLDSIFPLIGSTAGGQPVTISGSFFQPGVRVFFDDVESTMVTFQST